MLNKCLIVLFASVILSSCSPVHYDEKVVIKNINENQNVTLNIDKDRCVHSVLMKIIGKIEGEAVLNIISDEGIQDTINLNTGIIDLSVGKEWYSEKCILEYRPVKVENGKLLIEYKFKYIKEETEK